MTRYNSSAGSDFLFFYSSVFFTRSLSSTPFGLKHMCARYRSIHESSHFLGNSSSLAGAKGPRRSAWCQTRDESWIIAFYIHDGLPPHWQFCTEIHHHHSSIHMYSFPVSEPQESKFPPPQPPDDTNMWHSITPAKP